MEYTLTGDGKIPATLTLSGSQIDGVRYQLLKDGAISGTAVAGTGSALTFTDIIDDGTYTVEAQYGTMKKTMNGAVTVTEPTTLIFSSCANPEIVYNGGTSTINFVLSNNSMRDGAKIAQAVQTAFTTGTNAALAGALTVTCAKTGNFDGSLTFNLITQNSSPVDKKYTATVGGLTITLTHKTVSGSLLDFTLSSNGQIPATLTLSGSQSEGVTYQLLKDGTAVGAAVAGTGSALAFTNILDPGTYTVRAQYNSLTKIMTGNIVIQEPSDVIFLSGNQTIEFPYQNGTAQAVSFTLDNASNRDAAKIAQAVQSAFTGTHPALDGALTVTCTKTGDFAGTLTYNLTSVNTAPVDKQYIASVGGVQITLMHKTIEGSLWTYTLTGNGLIPVTLTLSGSQADGVTYQLLKDGTAVGTAVAGTGSPLSFANILDAGTYSIQAKYNTLTKEMTGSVQITEPSTLVFSTVETGKEFPYDGGTQGFAFTLDNNSMRDAAKIAQAVEQAFITANAALSGNLAVTATKTGDFAGTLTFKLSLTSYSPVDKTYSAMVGGKSISFVHKTITGSLWTYNLTGNGKMPATLTLSGSQAEGVKYQLYKDGVTSGTAVAGTGNAITFANIDQEGEYTAEAQYNTLKKTMDGIVTVVTPPITFTHVDEPKTLGYQGGSLTISFTLSADSYDDFDAIAAEVQAAFRRFSDIGTNFTVTAAKSSATAGAFTLKFDNINRYPYRTEYFIELRSKTIGFYQGMNGDGKWIFDFSGNGNTMTLSGSQPGVTYSLRRDGRVIETRNGISTGSALTFTVSGISSTTNGVYDIVASYENTTWTMNGHHAIANDPGLNIFIWSQRKPVPYTGGG
ncbi:MAG: hypothetical protein LUD76_06375, partial [Alistipes sp.]|nr:hypothetical protein [Alistipes sp.]